MRFVTTGLLITTLLVSGCANCSANGGWERTFNPVCIDN
jgi:hypothetical protein